jgi:hypothetical protein
MLLEQAMGSPDSKLSKNLKQEMMKKFTSFKAKVESK